MSNIHEGQIVLPNPLTPMAFLSPEIAFQVTIKSYVAVGITAVLIWDILNHLLDDYRLLTKHRIGIPTIVYLVSRVSILLYIIACVIFDTAPINHCVKLGRIVDWFFPFVQSSTSLLFFLRIWAIYPSHYVRAFFAVTWLAVAASTLTIGLGLQAGNIGTTPYCIYTRSTPYIVLTFITLFIHDTSVFIAITWRLLQNTVVDYNLSRGIRVVVFGDYLPIFTKTLLQDGQMYYLTTLMASLATVVLFYMPFAPSYKILFSLPNIVIINVMACRVYRNTKLGNYDSENELMNTSQLRFNTTTKESNEPIIPAFLSQKATTTR